MQIVSKLQKSCAALCLAAAIPMPALAQAGDEAGDEGSGDTPQTIMMRATEGEPIVVTGERAIEREELRDAVRDIAMRGRTPKRPLSQFQAPLCLNVTGLGDQFGPQVAERIRQNTRDAGAEVASSDCEVNALVVVVRDPDSLIKNLRKSQPDLFSVPVNRTIKAAENRGDAAIAWSVDRLGQARGGKLDRVGGPVGTAGLALYDNSGFEVPQTQSLGTTARSKIPFSIEKVYSIIIFDVDRLINVHVDQLADFATMRLLANPQPTVEIETERADSILTLFDMDPLDAPQGLTQIDRAYLKGLYALRPNDPATRLEGFVATAYDDIRASDCAAGRAAGCSPVVSDQ